MAHHESLIPRTSLRFLRSLRSDVGCLALWALVVVLLEVIGRVYRGFGADQLGMAVLVTMAYGTFRWHRSQPLGALSWLGERVRNQLRAVRQFYRNVGVDIREEPPYPEAVPLVVVGPLVFLIVTTAFLLLAHDWFPGRAFAVLATVSYTLYLVALATLWTLTLAGSLFLLFLFLGLVHDAFVHRHVGPAPRPVRKEIAYMVGLMALLTTLAILLPPWVPIAGIVAALAFYTVFLLVPGGPQATLLWRGLRDPSQVFRFDYRWVSRAELAFYGLGSLCIAMAAGGRSLFGGDPTASSMPATGAVAHIFVWVAFVGVVTLVFYLTAFIMRGRRGDPRIPVPPTLHVGGETTPALRRYLAPPLESLGWNVRFDPAPREPTDVPIVVADASRARDPSPPWPLPVAVADLEDPELLHRLTRRDRVQKRRLLVKGFEKLFKRAARRKFRQGHGFWIGLQHWYVPGVTRDTEEEEPDLKQDAVIPSIIGPPFHRVFSRPVRHHYGEITRALELDLVFIEDGVGIRGWVRVLRIMFEIYDMHDGGRRALDRDFTGLGGVRVIIHDIAPDRSFLSEVYPEPDYEEVGRARILHIFKDREEDPEHATPNLDLTSLPMPVLSF